MADDPVATVAAAYEAWTAGGVEGLLPHAAEDIEWDVRHDLPDAQLYRGHDGLRAAFARFAEVMDDIWFRPEELIPVGPDWVIVPLSWGGRGKGSGVEFEERRETWVFTVRGGKVWRVHEFATKAEALAAVGRLAE